MVLNLRFIQEFAPASVREACESVITKGKNLTEGVDVPNEKWIMKNMSEGLKQCRNLCVCCHLCFYQRNRFNMDYNNVFTKYITIISFLYVDCSFGYESVM